MKSKKFFFDFEKNDENKTFDDDESSVDENNLFDDMNESENQTDSAKISQKKNAIKRIIDEESKKSESKND